MLDMGASAMGGSCDMAELALNKYLGKAEKHFNAVAHKNT